MFIVLIRVAFPERAIESEFNEQPNTPFMVQYSILLTYSVWPASRSLADVDFKVA